MGKLVPSAVAASALTAPTIPFDTSNHRNISDLSSVEATLERQANVSIVTMTCFSSHAKESSQDLQSHKDNN